jgi:hypothetical protein
MKLSTEQIASKALWKTAEVNARLWRGVERIKEAEKKSKKKSPLSTPAFAALGAGGGGLLGAASGAKDQYGNIKKITIIKDKLPGQEAWAERMRKTQIPSRKKLLEALKQPLTAERNYELRRGLEEGFKGRSQSAKRLKVLKKIVKRGLLKNTGIGTGLGLGAGLLAATAFGNFD